MSKYIVETFYTCSFKIVHKLDELNEKKLSELENRNDGEVQIIDVKLNNRKTKIASKKEKDSLNKLETKNIPDISSIVNEKIINSDKLQISKISDEKNLMIQKLVKVCNLKENDAVFFSCDKVKNVEKISGHVRQKLGNELNLSNVSI